MKLKIWQKGNTGALAGRTLRLKEMTGETTGGKPPRDGLASTAAAGVMNERRQEKEIMTEFIAKKREMFLVQMSLDTKREEIRKLEEKAQMKEEALQKSEQMLEEDAIRFDTFLKENDFNYGSQRSDGRSCRPHRCNQKRTASFLLSLGSLG